MSGHFAAKFPTIRCERCKKLGHMAQICQAVRPWECIATMCGFQSPGLGFFYFPDACAGKTMKERASSVIISVLEGNPNFRDIETEFNAYFGPGWRCTARVIRPGQFSMRFPSPKEVERTCYFGKRIEMKTFDGVLNIAPWSEAAGAKAPLHKAWVKVRNIPPEKKCDETAAYAGSLVGVSLEIDQATLHKHEYCRVLIGCRDIHQLPEAAEGVLGDYFYDFYYEVDSILVGGQPRNKSALSVDSHQAPSPKRPRIENSDSINHEESSTGIGGNTSYSDYRGGKSYSQKLPVLSEHASEEERGEESDEESEEQGLLIEQLAKEGQHGEKNVEVEQSVSLADGQSENENRVVDNSSLGSTNVDMNETHDKDPADMGQKDMDTSDVTVAVESTPPGEGNNSLMIMAPVTPVPMKKMGQLDDSNWPPLSNVVVTEMEDGPLSSNAKSSAYTMQSPKENSSNVDSQGTETAPEVENFRASHRNQVQKLGKVAEQASNRSNKRNLEGLYKEEDKMAICAGADELMKTVAEISGAEKVSPNAGAAGSSGYLMLTAG